LGALGARCDRAEIARAAQIVVAILATPLRRRSKYHRKSEVRSGAEHALALRMPIRKFSDLICWRLARALQREVFKITAKPAFKDNFDLRDELRDAAGSARRNIAEGFGRRTHKDQANFFATALTSLNEVEDELGEAAG
jgi:hypothetical protein